MHDLLANVTAHTKHLAIFCSVLFQVLIFTNMIISLHLTTTEAGHIPIKCPCSCNKYVHKKHFLLINYYDILTIMFVKQCSHTKLFTDPKVICPVESFLYCAFIYNYIFFMGAN